MDSDLVILVSWYGNTEQEMLDEFGSETVQNPCFK